MALRTVLRPGLAGVVPNPVAVAASDTFQNDGETLIHVVNGAATPTLVAVNDPNTGSPAHAKAFDADSEVSVAAGAERYIGPFDPKRFNDANGLATVTYSVTALVTAEYVSAG